MGKIVQIIDSFYNERLSFRICEVVGTYNNPFAPPSRLIVGSNKFLSWEFDKWLPEVKDFVNLEKKSLRYGRVLVVGDEYEITKYRIWNKIVQIKYARRLRHAKNKICLILGIDEGGTVILARSSSLSWKIPKDLISHLVKCNFTSKESKKLNLICGRYIEPKDITCYVKYRIWIS